TPHPLVPAQAGTQGHILSSWLWIPACAGMSGGTTRFDVVPAGASAAGGEPGPMNTGHAVWRSREACGHGTPLSGSPRNSPGIAAQRDNLASAIFVGARHGDDAVRGAGTEKCRQRSGGCLTGE